MFEPSPAGYSLGASFVASTICGPGHVVPVMVGVIVGGGLGVVTFVGVRVHIMDLVAGASRRAWTGPAARDRRRENRT